MYYLIYISPFYYIQILSENIDVFCIYIQNRSSVFVIINNKYISNVIWIIHTSWSEGLILNYLLLNNI